MVATPDELTERQPVSPIDMTPEPACPLLGLFGADDRNPSPEMVAQIEAALKANGKDYEFHTYDGAGHAFFSVDRPNFNVAAVERRLAADLGLLRQAPRPDPNTQLASIRLV